MDSQEEIMTEERIGTLVLSGLDAETFVNSLYRPTHEEIENHNRILDEINNSIIITEEQQGFTAEIDDLDLSFLDDKKEESIIMQVTLSLLQFGHEYYNKNESWIADSVKLSTMTTLEYKSETYSSGDILFAA